VSTATAQLKAVLGMDNAQFKAKATESTAVTKSLQNEIGGVGRAVAGAFSLAALAAGARAIGQWSKELRAANAAGKLEFIDQSELDKIDEFGARYEKSMMKAKAGAVGAAAALGGFIEKIAVFAGAVSAGGGVEGGVDAITDAERDAAESIAKRRADAAAAETDKMRAENEKIRMGSLEGRDKTKSEYEASVAAIEKERAAIPDDEFAREKKSVLDERQKMIEAQYKADVAAHDKAEREKRESEVKTEAGRVAADQRRAAAIDQQIAADERSGLTGDAKIRADSNAEIAATVEQRMEAMRAGNKAEGEALGRRIDSLRAKQEQDVAAFKTSERDKALEPLNRERESIMGKMAGLSETTGRDVNFDSMARMGGMVGGERAGVGIADRQKAIGDKMQELVVALKENTEAVQAINESGG